MKPVCRSTLKLSTYLFTSVSPRGISNSHVHPLALLVEFELDSLTGSDRFSDEDERRSMKYFAYGSNMDATRMKERGVRFSARVPAVLEGHVLRFNKTATRNPKQGYANIVEDRDQCVEGCLYDMVDPDIANLDEYEGYPKQYDRKTLPVRLNDGNTVQAAVYVAQPDRVKAGLKPTKDYLDHLLSEKDMLSSDYYKKLASTETLD